MFSPSVITSFPCYYSFNLQKKRLKKKLIDHQVIPPSATHPFRNFGPSIMGWWLSFSLLASPFFQSFRHSADSKPVHYTHAHTHNTLEAQCEKRQEALASSIHKMSYSSDWFNCIIHIRIKETNNLRRISYSRFPIFFFFIIIIIFFFIYVPHRRSFLTCRKRT